ncbi:tRNA (N6-isopentenyl adenosine(37)-C2)-methylthiotransferase MiaB [Selenomonas sp. TAMA-11512]|nr:tRNA (N6-isopentenyl adenosine(37)-C2)-methylthiotransferase MiaB [Selenomonas sp. TAMA-11512]
MNQGMEYKSEREDKKAYIGIYGCQMNIADAERMEGQLGTLGYTRTEDMTSADLILLNTCCIRETAEDKVYGKIGEIKHLKKNNPELIFGIAGCMAQKEGNHLIARAPHIDFVLGTNKINELPQIVREIEAEHGASIVDVAEMMGIHENIPIKRTGSLSAWVPIMYGCNNFCTYCIVPYVRGREQSRAPKDIVEEVQDAAAKGFKEVTLLGQNVNSYGKDHKEADFAELLRMVDAVPGIERVRYMTSHPKDLSDRVIESVRDGKHIAEHFHIPVQHGSARILKAMNRVYTKEAYRSLVKRIRAAVPHASITTDLIVGFPGESEEDFLELLEFLREIRYDAAYTFLYSKRSGTPAATMEGQVSDEEKHRRLTALMEVQNEISLEKNQALLGKDLEVLVEGASKTDENVWTGRTRTNKIVLWTHGAEAVGDLVQVRITNPQTWVLKGELL